MSGTALTYFEGAWHEGNPPLMRATDQATWLGTVVFDGARAFENLAPDLDLHCQRVIRSAAALGMNASVSAAEIQTVAMEGVRRMGPGAAIYIRPMMWARSGLVMPDPDDIGWAVVLEPFAMPGFDGFTANFAQERRAMPSMAPTDAKASCLYPNSARAIAGARRAGFNNAVMLDVMGNVAEFASSNLFMVKDGVALTPIANGTFLAGITRARVMGLLKADGVKVEEAIITPAMLRGADEIFSTGNYGKVAPLTRLEDRNLQAGPVTRRARQLYWDWAAATSRY